MTERNDKLAEFTPRASIVVHTDDVVIEIDAALIAQSSSPLTFDATSTVIVKVHQDRPSDARDPEQLAQLAQLAASIRNQLCEAISRGGK